MLTLMTAQRLRARSLSFIRLSHPFLPPVMNAAFVECIGNVSDPAHCGKGKHPTTIVPLWLMTKSSLGCGMNVACIQLFFSFVHNRKEYPCTLVDWFSTMGQSHDIETGMWKVHPDIQQGQHLSSVIHLDSFLHRAHLLPIFGQKFLPINFDYTDSLDTFASYYVNHFADHHSHEIIF